MNDMQRMMSAVTDQTLLIWLSALFASAPTAETVAAHRRGAAGQILDALSHHDEFATGCRQMRTALDKPSDDAALAAELARKYGFLFDGIGGPGTVPPYESVFRPGAAWRLFQEPFSEMNALLGKHHLSVSSNTVPADHLSMELALAAHLAAAADRDFLEMTNRLASWVPGFAARCMATDEGGFWGGAARVLAAAVFRAGAHTKATDANEKAL